MHALLSQYQVVRKKGKRMISGQIRLALQWAAIGGMGMALSIPIRAAGQEGNLTTRHQYKHYKLIDLGTLDGPASYFTNGLDGFLNNQGTAAGWADTSMSDPFPDFCFNPDCFVSHAIESKNGVVSDLGVLPGGMSSQAWWTTPNGLIAGDSQNGLLDPLVPGLPETRGVIWQKGQIVSLGTLEGGYESFCNGVNSRTQAVGVFLNTVPDPFSFFGSFYPYQARAFLWENGAMRDLGDLGGPDANAFFVNGRGQIAGQSYTNSTPNPVTGVPTADPFFWENGRMLDLGGLGGTYGIPAALNIRGQVVGTSNTAGDNSFLPFLWAKGDGMRKLRTLGGLTGEPTWISDTGDIVGKADLPGPMPQYHDAVLWRDGAITNLGTLPGESCSNAYFVNSLGQIVGTSEDRTSCVIPTGEHAFLWEHPGPMVDLNTLIPSGSSLQLVFAFAINDRGEIAGAGVPQGCAAQDYSTCGHAFVLIPCEDGDRMCELGWPSATSQTSAAWSMPHSATAAASPALGGRGLLDRIHTRRGQGIPIRQSER
jgi:probable HAF family extracellular repeat protein